MADQLCDFGQVAKGLARNPLGIIALFIVLVYGLASLVIIFSGSMTPSERTPIIYFLVSFPIIVLSVFAWLVSCHSEKLFAPSDFRNEDNYVRMKLSAAVSLGVAATKSPKIFRSKTSKELCARFKKFLPHEIRQAFGRPTKSSG